MQKNNSVIKLILFLLFFMVVLTAFLLIYIIPTLKEYKSNKEVLNSYEKLYKKEIRTLEKLTNIENELKVKYKKEIVKYNNKFDEEKFKLFLQQSLQNVKIENLTNKGKNLTYKVEGNIEKLNNLYIFLEKLNIYNNFAKINFPLTYIVKKESIFLTLNVTILLH